MKKWKEKNKISVDGSLKDTIDMHDPQSSLLKIKMLKLKTSIMLVHHRHLKLKLTDIDLFT